MLQVKLLQQTIREWGSPTFRLSSFLKFYRDLEEGLVENEDNLTNEDKLKKVNKENGNR